MISSKIRGSVAAIALLALMSGLASGDQPPSLSEPCLLNSNVQWKGTPLGLIPLLDSTAQRVLDRLLSAHEESFASQLELDVRALLRDPSSFACAHVILSFAHHENVVVSADEWNGLQIALVGRVGVVDPRQVEFVTKYWADRPTLGARRR